MRGGVGSQASWSVPGALVSQVQDARRSQAVFGLPVEARGFHRLLVIVAVMVASCGRVGVHLLPLDHAGSSGAPAQDAGSGNEDAGLDAAAASDAGDSDANLDAASDAGDSDASMDAANHAGDSGASMDAASDAAGSDAAVCSDASSDGALACCDATAYTPDANCGVGYCRSTNKPSSCVAGVETLCQPGAPLSSDDSSADAVDDDCDGQVDEDACVPRTDLYRAGSFTLMPPKGCGTLTVKLWGGAGASGDAQAGYWANVTGGQGGPGGYVTNVTSVTASTSLLLYVGQGGKGCGAAGNGGLAAHSGGTGGTDSAEAGKAGADGSRTGGSGGKSNRGGDGGAGSLGGGGGGAGTDPGFAPHGAAGGGGAATVLMFDGTALIAGGGGGGGGAGSDIATAGHNGGDGGSGCGGNGVVESTEGGGGGGGGVCSGQTTHAGSGRLAYDPASELSSGAAQGGDGSKDCDPGGDGYAIVSFSR